MTVIWKYPFDVDDSFELNMPQGAKILTVQEQDRKGCMWAIVNPENEIESRRFCILGTGHMHPLDFFLSKRYIGTFQQPFPMGGSLVWHLFEHISPGDN